MPDNTYPPYSTDGGALTIPRQLYRWIDLNPQGGSLGRAQTYVKLPAFGVSNLWDGYSDIVLSVNFQATNNFSIRPFYSKPLNPTYTLCISYHIGTTVTRYVLWAADGDTIEFPAYAGQPIKKNFRLEVWSAGSNTTDTNEWLFYTSVLQNVDYRFAGDSPLAAGTPNFLFAASFNGTTLPGTPDVRWSPDNAPVLQPSSNLVVSWSPTEGSGILYADQGMVAWLNDVTTGITASGIESVGTYSTSSGTYLVDSGGVPLVDSGGSPIFAAGSGGTTTPEYGTLICNPPGPAAPYQGYIAMMFVPYFTLGVDPTSQLYNDGAGFYIRFNGTTGLFEFPGSNSHVALTPYIPYIIGYNQMTGAWKVWNAAAGTTVDYGVGNSYGNTVAYHKFGNDAGFSGILLTWEIIIYYTLLDDIQADQIASYLTQKYFTSSLFTLPLTFPAASVSANNT